MKKDNRTFLRSLLLVVSSTIVLKQLQGPMLKNVITWSPYWISDEQKKDSVYPIKHPSYPSCISIYGEIKFTI